MKKKLGLYLERCPSEGGAFQYNKAILDAVAALPSDEFDVLVASPFHETLEVVGAKKLSTCLVKRGIWGRVARKIWRAMRFPPALWYRIAPFAMRLERWLVRQDVDLWIFPGQDDIAYRKSLPSIGVIHDMMHKYERRFPEVGSAYAYAWRDAMFSMIAKNCVGALVDSGVGRKHVVDAYQVPAEQIYPLPFIAPDYIQEDVPTDFAQKWKLPPKYLFYPAQFWKHKNHENLLLALKKVKVIFPDIHCVFSGAKKLEYERVQQQVLALGLEDNVFFPGYVPDEYMAGFYKKARALVMPTFFGPTNIPPLEAMALGCPVAVSGIYGMPEQLGDAALYFSPESIEDIASVVERLWGDDALCRIMSNKGLERSLTWQRADFEKEFCNILRNVFRAHWN